MNILGFNSRPVGHPNHDVFAALDPGADVFRKSGIVFRNRHAGFGGFECSVVVRDELARKVNGSLWDKAVVVHKNRDHVIELPTDIANFFGQGSHVVDAASRLAARTLTGDGAKYELLDQGTGLFDDGLDSFVFEERGWNLELVTVPAPTLGSFTQGVGVWGQGNALK